MIIEEYTGEIFTELEFARLMNEAYEGNWYEEDNRFFAIEDDGCYYDVMCRREMIV